MVVPLDVLDALGSPVKMNGAKLPAKMLVHSVPLGETHSITVKVMNTHTSNLTIRGDVGMAIDCIDRVVIKKKLLALNFVMVGGPGATIRLGVTNEVGKVWIMGWVTSTWTGLPAAAKTQI